MAAGVLQAPGTEYGPCAVRCEHRDCRLTRKMATSRCRHCGGQIGYDRRFYSDDEHSDRWLHADCEEKRIEAEQEARRVATEDGVFWEGTES